MVKRWRSRRKQIGGNPPPPDPVWFLGRWGMNSPRPSSNVLVETPVIDGVSLEEYKARLGLSADNRGLDGALRYHEARVKAQRGPVEDAVVLYKRLLDLLPAEPRGHEDLAALYTP